MKQTRETLKQRAKHRRSSARVMAAAACQDLLGVNFRRDGEEVGSYRPTLATTTELLALVHLERRLRPVFAIARRLVTQRYEIAGAQRRAARKEG